MRNILCFEAESNGLHGAAFAIGGVVIDETPGHVLDRFAARAPDPSPCDPWVQAHVLPALVTMPMTHRDARAMRETFWCWLQNWRQRAMVVVDFGWPVETNLLSACVADEPGRGFMGPCPLNEVASLMIAAGLDPDKKYGPELLPGAIEHHPQWDAHVSALCARLALQRIKELGR